MNTPKEDYNNILLRIEQLEKDIKDSYGEQKQLIQKELNYLEGEKDIYIRHFKDVIGECYMSSIYDDKEINERINLVKTKKKPKTKKEKDKKFKKVMKEFGKGELKPYHSKKNLKSKKQGGSEKERKQALAIAFKSSGLDKVRENL